MAIPLKKGTNGNLAQFATGDALQVQSIEPRTTSSNLVIGSTLSSTAKVVLGSATNNVEVLNDLLLSAGSLVGGAGVGSLGSSVTDYFTGVWVQAVNDAGPDLVAYGLNVSGTNAGAYSIGVDPSLISSSSATDLMTMLDELDAAISAAGTTTETLTIQTGVTIAPGDCVATSLTTAGTVALADSTAAANPNFVGICVSVTNGGVNPGTCTFVKPGNKVTVSGATFTTGGPLYMPGGGSTPSQPTQTAPTGAGDIVQRIGWALSTTDFIVSDLVGVSL